MKKKVSTVVNIMANGKISLPRDFCQELKLTAGTKLTLYRIADALIMFPKNGDFVLPELPIDCKKSGPDEMLSTLQLIRERLYRKRYGKATRAGSLSLGKHKAGS